jgi:hypothetical protein
MGAFTFKHFLRAFARVSAKKREETSRKEKRKYALFPLFAK